MTRKHFSPKDLLLTPDVNFESKSKGLSSDSNINIGPPFETPAAYISRLNYENKIIMYTLFTTNLENAKIERYLKERNAKYAVLYLDKIGDEGLVLELELKRKTNQGSPPWVFVTGQYRPLESLIASFHDGSFEVLLDHRESNFDYDLIIIGDGTAAFSAAKAAVKYNRKVLVCDISDSKQPPLPEKIFSVILSQVEPNQDSSKTWYAAMKMGRKLCEKFKNDFIQAIKSLRVDLVQEPVSFINNHEIRLAVQDRTVSGLNFLLAMNRECCKESPLLTPGKLFNRNSQLGETLVLGNATTALEVATFLNALRVPVTLFFKQQMLKHFDQECVQMSLASLAKAGVQIESCIVENIGRGKSGKTIVSGYRVDTKKPFKREFNTVVDAAEKAFKDNLNLYHIGVETDAKTTYILCDKNDETSVKNIYAVGGIVYGKPNSSLMAENAGRLLSERLFGMKDWLMQYSFVPTVIYGMLEFGSIGKSEEAAREAYGNDSVVVFKSSYNNFGDILEVDHRENFIKLVCKAGGDVVGVHIIGRNVASILLGYSLALRNNLKKCELDATVIHDMSDSHMTSLIL